MKILFQGDSITDAGRDRSEFHDLGNGYPKYAAAMISDSFPETEFEFINLGISGDRTEQLVNRLQTEFIDIQPDIVSVLVGVNDVWHFFSHGIETTDEYFESNLRRILTALKEKTHAKILMIEPFLLFANDKEELRAPLDAKINIYRRLAREFADAYLPMDGIYAAACVNTKDPTVFSNDGVHPNEEGSRFFGEQYLKAITPLIAELVEEN